MRQQPTPTTTTTLHPQEVPLVFVGMTGTLLPTRQFNEVVEQADTNPAYNAALGEQLARQCNALTS